MLGVIKGYAAFGWVGPCSGLSKTLVANEDGINNNVDVSGLSAPYCTYHLVLK